jgi:hypothetical protein
VSRPPTFLSLVGLLERLVPLAAAVARAVRALAFAGLGAVAVIAVAVVARWLPEETGSRVALAVVLALLLVPPGILLAFYLSLRELVALPERLRRYPDLPREHVAELAAIVRDADDASRPAWRRLPRSAWRLSRLVRSARELLAPHAPVLPLLSPPFLAATAASALACVLLVGAALVVALVVALA